MDKLLNDLRTIVDYMYKDEERNWEECDKPTKNHIFLNIRRVDKYLKKKGV
jgi:hypothetical protein